MRAAKICFAFEWIVSARQGSALLVAYTQLYQIAFFMVGFAPSSLPLNSLQYDKCGWYLYAANGLLYSAKHRSKDYPGSRPLQAGFSVASAA